MHVELESLVNHLYVVDGRAVRAAPPGALVQSAPRRSARTRSQDMFFALLNVTGKTRAPASLYEELVRVAADTYFHAKGTTTSGLREAIDAVNESLLAYNLTASTVLQAHLVCGAMRSGDVYVAQVGACQVFLQQSGTVHRFPGDAEALQSTPLGLRSHPNIGLNHYTVAAGDVLILSDSTLARLARDKSEAALKAPGAGEVIEALKPLVDETAMVLAMQLVTPGDLPAAEAPQTSPEGEAEAEEGEPEGRGVPGVDVEGGLYWIGRTLALGVAGLTAAAGRLLDVFFPEPDEEDSAGVRIPTSLAAGLTVLIAFAVTVVVVGVMLRNYGRDRCEDYVRVAEEEAARAKNLVGHPEAREAWEAVKLRLEQAMDVCPPTNPQPLQALEEARGFIDEYDQVVRPRPSVTQLRTYPAGAVLHGPVLHFPDVYVLDVENAAIYRDQLADSGYEIENAATSPVLSAGDGVDGYTIQQLVDIEWMDEGTARTRSMLVSLEPTAGVMIAYSPTLPPAAAPLQGWEEWGAPAAIATWGGNFYILDPGADQIWRYRLSASTGEYTDPPERYFENLATNPDLEGAIDLAIDEQGNVYVLFEDERVAKYFGSELIDFSLESLPVPLRDVRALHLDSSAFAQSLYLVDAGNESIFETTLRGNFAYHYRAANEEAFDDLRGVYVKPGTENIYVIANDSLYYFNAVSQNTP